MATIRELKAKADLIKAEIKLKEAELESVKEQLVEMEWVPIEWDELKKLLQTEYDGKDYQDCPTVSQKGGRNRTYCSLITMKVSGETELQIGPFYFHDFFPRGKPLYIHHERKTWRGY